MGKGYPKMRAVNGETEGFKATLHAAMACRIGRGETVGGDTAADREVPGLPSTRSNTVCCGRAKCLRPGFLAVDAAWG